LTLIIGHVLMTKNPYTEIWNLATEEIAKIYEPETFDFLEKKIPELYRKIQFAEDRINLHWGKDLSFFKGSVGLWKDLMRQAIQKFYDNKIRTTGFKIAASPAIAERIHDRGITTSRAPETREKPVEKRQMNVFERIRETRGEDK